MPDIKPIKNGVIISGKEFEKGVSVPCRALPEEKLNSLVFQLCEYLEKLLSLKQTEQNEERLLMLLPQIKSEAWNISVKDMVAAFQYYIDGKLSYNKQPLEPISGYLDAILFKKVISAYKGEKKITLDLKQIVISIQGKKLYELNEGDLTITPGTLESFDYLLSQGILPKREVAEKRYSEFMLKAGTLLTAHLVDYRKELEREGYKNSPAWLDVQKEIRKVITQEHRGTVKLMKALVLESFFEKLKEKGADLSKMI